MTQKPFTFFHVETFIPSLKEAFERNPLNMNSLLRVAMPIANPDEHPNYVPNLKDRRQIGISDSKEVCFWEVDSLKSLFRGDKQPPFLGATPQCYEDIFPIIDLHIIELGNFFGSPRDAELRDIFSALRRRPDGKSLGVSHDYLWQAVAFILGTQPLSQAEFEAIMARIERSCRTFEDGVSSRNFSQSLQKLYKSYCKKQEQGLI
jgi:hypothetical protein